MAKVTFEFSNPKLANIFAILVEGDTELVELLNEKIREFNDSIPDLDDGEPEEDLISEIDTFDVDFDTNNTDPEHIITINNI